MPSREGIDAVAEAYADVGMRAVLAPMMADRTLYDALPGLMEALPPHLQERARQMQAAPHEASIAACSRDPAAIGAKTATAATGARPDHSAALLGRVSRSACARLAEECDVGLQTHLAESKTQAVLGLKKYGRSLVAHLQSLGVLSPRFSAAHGIWLDRDDIARLGGRRAQALFTTR